MTCAARLGAFSLCLAASAWLPLFAEEPPTAPLVTPLGKTIRLQFTLAADEFSQSFSVVCADSEYVVHFGQSDGGDEFSIDVKGTVTEREGGKYCVTFKAVVDRTDQDGGFDLAATGSSVMELGKPKKLCALSSYTLTLLAIDDEGEDAVDLDRRKVPGNTDYQFPPDSLAIRSECFVLSRMGLLERDRMSRKK